MTFFRLGFGYGIPNTACLEEEFDAPDVAADRELCCAIVAGKAGLHPDGWGNHDPLTVLPPHFRSYEPPLQAYAPPVDRSADPAWEYVQRRPSLPPPPPRRLAYAGEVQLTCDECHGPRFDETMLYREGQRDQAVATIRQRARKYGWTCIAGRDRCPKCSQAAAPEPVSDGAGEGDGDEQDA